MELGKKFIDVMRSVYGDEHADQFIGKPGWCDICGEEFDMAEVYPIMSMGIICEACLIKAKEDAANRPPPRPNPFKVPNSTEEHEVFVRDL